MNYTIPNKILITSDNNQLQFIKIKKVGKEELFVYRFIVSETKMDMEVEFTESSLKRYLSNTFKVIE